VSIPFPLPSNEVSFRIRDSGAFLLSAYGSRAYDPKAVVDLHLSFRVFGTHHSAVHPPWEAESRLWLVAAAFSS